MDPEIFQTDFELEGSSNYAFNLILNEKDFDLRNKIEKNLANHQIEFRRGSAGGGNQLRQPYLKDYVSEGYWQQFPNTEHIHHFGWYIGNYPDLEKNKIDQICSILNNI